MLYLDVTGRNDWSSSLPSANKSFFYPSVSGSFIFSELDALSSSNILSFGKVRLGWAQVGSDALEYKTQSYLELWDPFGSAATVRENARLQSFPDDFQFIGSKTNQNKQVGNAVPVLLSQAIAMYIKSYLK